MDPVAMRPDPYLDQAISRGEGSSYEAISPHGVCFWLTMDLSGFFAGGRAPGAAAYVRYVPVDVVTSIEIARPRSVVRPTQYGPAQQSNADQQMSLRSR
jgi:hypothetical protein